MNCEPATVAACPATRRLESEVERLAATPRSTVSILGEAGVGKQAWARRLHASSSRAAGPFVVWHPGRPLDEELLARAEGGTLYLREAAELTPVDQALLLDVLTQHRAGPTTEDDRSGFRLVAASRRTDGSGLREDLDYRLNVLVLEVPPLAERPEEIPALAAALLPRLARELGLPARPLSAEAEADLLLRPWPGNLHALSAALRQALLQGFQQPQEGALERVPDPYREDVDQMAPLDVLDELSLDHLEERAVRQALADSGGNRSLAARRLGIHRTTLYHKLKRFDLG